MKLLICLAIGLSVTATATADTEAPAPRAVQCVSVFEIMDRAAPNWMAQPSVQLAKRSWQDQAEMLSVQNEVDYGTQLNREMVRLADASSENPDILANIALNCLAEAKV